MSSNISVASASTESSDSQKEDDTNKDLKGKEESSLCPFKLLWSFGLNSEVPVINLTTQNRTIIAYACSHTVIIYNYVTKEVVNLQGHQNAVKRITASVDGKWLLSAGFGEDCVLVVWDTETGVPVCTLFNPHGKYAMTAARISPNAKYIVTVGNEIQQRVHFWLWTYGKDEPDGVLELTETVTDRAKTVAFNDEVSEEFALTADYNIIFCKWSGLVILPFVVLLLWIRLGYVMVWSMAAGADITERKHLKSVQLHKCSITVLVHHDDLVVLGTAEGRICFYGLDLRILYSYQNPYMNCITSISFELRSSLLGPVSIVSESELEFSDEEHIEYEGELEILSESKLQEPICDEKIKYLRKLQSIEADEVSSSMSINMETTFKDHNKGKKKFRRPTGPTDATLEGAPFYTSHFIVSSLNGTVALIDIPELKCNFIFRHVSGPITSLDTHPRSDFIVTGNIHGAITLYDYKKCKLIVSRKSPPLPDFNLLFDIQVKWGNIIYFTCPQINEKATAVTVLKYSPVGDLLACGLENGTLWMLHPVTLDPLDRNPYKHSSESIQKLVFTECGEYMAYSDNTLVVAVFKKNHATYFNYIYDFLGKYHVHHADVRDLLFGPATSSSGVPRLFSLGEDQNLIEYNLKESGPYPDPGLLIAEIHKIEYTATPLCLNWYPELGVERFLMISNSEFKYKLLNDVTKMNRGTFLGPLFNTPVRYLKVLPTKELKGGGYMVFATEREIGLQIYPFDGNPYKILGMIGHPRKITNLCTNNDGSILFTSGDNDPCVLMWKIKCRAVDVIAHLGGEGLDPYYCLIQGGKKGWLFNEMRDLFYYAQILQQGENTTATRIVSEKVSIKQIPNLMRAVGYYPSNEEIELLLAEISYKNYANTGQMVEEITFEDFVKFYINHRPAAGISMRQLQEAFQTFANPHENVFFHDENAALSRGQFMKILFGEGPDGIVKDDNDLFGEPLTPYEAFIFLKFLMTSDDHMEDMYLRNDARAPSVEFSFLPQVFL
nr:PREDICTED: WD repeat-containing protein 66-like [Megachile rotundata]